MADRSVNWRTYICHVGDSDVGLRRANNQDSFGVVLASSEDAWRQRGHLFLVADGMGAHAAGELASKIAVDTVPHNYHKSRDKPPPDALEAAIAEANHVIHHRGQVNPDFQGMGTTCSALVLLPEQVFIGHVGDSRVYRLRGDKIEQLSFDHSLVWELTAGGLKEGELGGNIPKNIITRSLGPHPDVEVDLEGPLPVAVGDCYLLCSDGLSGQVKDEEIGAALRTLPPEEAVQSLIDLANLRGGPDNITIVAIRVEGSPAHNGPSTAEELAGRRRTPALVWLVVLVSLAVAAGLALLDPLLGGIALVVGFAATVVAYGKLAPKSPRQSERSLGRAPYRSYSATPDASLCAELADTFEQLRGAALEEDWTLDWNRIETLTREAQEATAAKRFDTAAAAWLRAVSFVVEEAKGQRGQAPGRGTE